MPSTVVHECNRVRPARSEPLDQIIGERPPACVFGPVIHRYPDAAPGHADGDLCTLGSPIAEVTVRLRFDPEQRRDVVIYAKGRWGKFGGPNSLVRARETDAGGGAAYYDQGVRIV